MKNWESVEEQNQERRQLEEIAHLYFSNSDNTAKKVQSRKKKPSIQPSPTAPLFIYGAASSAESTLSCYFLYNLSVMLKILGEQVLFVGSDLAFKNRFSFGFRPYRERYPNGRRDGLRGCYGPMGVCLLSLKDMKRRETDKINPKVQADPASPLANSLPFRFILSDQASPKLFSGSLPSLILFLVTPITPKGAFASLISRIGEDFSPSLGHFGIVVLNTKAAEEAEYLRDFWQDQLQEIGAENIIMENYGHFPANGTYGNLGLKGDLEVLTSPLSPQTISYQKAASRIRRKRVEVLAALS